MPPSLFEQVLGERFESLAPAVQRFHRLAGHVVLQGRAQTVAPTTFAARVLTRLFGTPAGGAEGPLRFELSATADHEVWTRHFSGIPGRTMVSKLSRQGTLLEERLGPVCLTFEVSARSGRLQMRLVKLRALGLPWPTRLLPRVVAEESGEGDELHFEVAASWPLVGTVARYRGHVLLGSGARR